MIDALKVRTLDQEAWKKRRVLCRVDFNVAVGDDNIVDDYEDYRIKSALPTIKELREKGATVVLLTHRGRPRENPDDADLEPIRKRVAELLGIEVVAIPELYGDQATAMLERLQVGDVAMLPNVRLDPEEERASEGMARRLAKDYDAYVNEAFSVCHRAHTSVTIVPRILPACAGRRLVQEIEKLEKLRQNPEKPYVAIVSGNKVVTKIGLLYRLLREVDKLCIGGRIANVFLTVDGSYETNEFSTDDLTAARAIWEKYREKIVLPVDLVCGNKEGTETKVVVAGTMKTGQVAFDIGPESADIFARTAAEAKTVMWNGPVGMFEVAAYAQGTTRLAEGLSVLNNYRVIGGGDTVVALEKLGIRDKFDHVSVGGGAMVAFLEGKLMPGLEALKL